MAAEEVPADGVDDEPLVGHYLRPYVVFVVFVAARSPRVSEPSVVLDLFVITREQRQVLSSNRCVVSGLSRDVRDRTREWCGVELRW